jgi:ribose-phosphate pyrophosphokinase
LITIDPHLHRWPTLDAIYPIANQVLHATACIASWIKQHISDPVLIGPDIESRQWVSQIASKINAPFLILDKVRKGDQEVEVSIPQIELYRNCTPILVDDIISTAATMIDTVTHLKSLKMKPPLCIGVHPIFAGNAYNDLVESGADRIVSCNTINHPSNEIDVSELIANSLAIFDKKK